MKIFVAGATGVLGRRVVRELIQNRHEVIGITRSQEKASQLHALGARAALVDLFDSSSLLEPMKECDVVCNVATHIPSSSRSFLPWAWKENDRIRREGSASLVDAIRKTGVDRYIQESFAPIYSDQGDAWITEQSPVAPAPHTRTSLEAERQAERVTASGGVGVVLRFGLFYAPDAAHTLDMVKFVRRGMAPAFGRPDGYLSSIHVDDAARAVVAALDLPTGKYNVVDDEPVTRREYVDVLARSLGVAPPRMPPAILTRLSGSVGEALSRSQRISNRLIKENSDWSPQFPSVREGWPAVIEEMFELASREKHRNGSPAP